MICVYYLLGQWYSYTDLTFFLLLFLCFKTINIYLLIMDNDVK